ncbi:MAG: SufE family protein [Pseudomonadota bacterium]
MNWEQQYRRLVKLSRELPPFPPALKDETHRVSGCEAQVWLYVDSSNPDAVKLRFDSGSRIVKGLLALIQQRLDGQPRQVIQQFDIEDLFREEGLQGHLSPSRANGLAQVGRALKSRV